ncbi:MAG: hypothetical protein AB8H86_22180, partial [Polyangiales bacterium]
PGRMCEGSPALSSPATCELGSDVTCGDCSEGSCDGAGACTLPVDCSAAGACTDACASGEECACDGMGGCACAST